MPRMAKYAIYIEFVFSLQSLELLTPTHPQFWTKIWLTLGRQLPFVRVRLGEDHLGCCQPSQLGRSSHLACSRPACPTPGIMRRFYTRINLHSLILAWDDIIRFRFVQMWFSLLLRPFFCFLCCPKWM